MATEIDQVKVNKLVKAGKSHAEVANELKVTQGQLGMLRYGIALVAAGKLAKAPATTASFKKLRNEGLRWEYISAATGASVAKIKDAVGDVAIPRGRRAGSSNGSASKTSASKTKTGSKTKTAGRGSSKKTAAARNRTRAGRAAASGNPS